MSEWQPIESAPKDGTRIILTDDRNVEVGVWAPALHGDTFGWAFVDDFSVRETTDGNVAVEPNAWRTEAVKRWMPLPSAPAGER